MMLGQRLEPGDGSHRAVEHGVTWSGHRAALLGNGTLTDEALLPLLSPLAWEHIDLIGDYLWRSSAKVGAGKFRVLRPVGSA